MRLFLLLSVAVFAGCLDAEEFAAVQITAIGDSGVAGTAEFKDYALKGGSQHLGYWIDVTVPEGLELDALLQSGTCENLGSERALLSVNLETPMDEPYWATIDSPDNLGAVIDSPHAVVVRKKGIADSRLACGNLPDHAESR